jgi:glutathione S-transferase
MPTFKLTYFNAAGRAEPIRVALRLAGLDFEDHRVAFPEFAALKESGALPLGQLPVFAVDGVTMAETGAMLRYIARSGAPDLYPADAHRAFVVDSALDAFNDTLSHALTPSFVERDMEKKLELRKAFVAGPMARVFGYVEGLLERFGGPFVGGKVLSIADLVIAQQILAIRSGNLDGVTTEALAPYPRLNALTDAYLAEPRIAALNAK